MACAPVYCVSPPPQFEQLNATTPGPGGGDGEEEEDGGLLPVFVSAWGHRSWRWRRPMTSRFSSKNGITFYHMRQTPPKHAWDSFEDYHKHTRSHIALWLSNPRVSVGSPIKLEATVAVLSGVIYSRTSRRGRQAGGTPGKNQKAANLSRAANLSAF